MRVRAGAVRVPTRGAGVKYDNTIHTSLIKQIVSANQDTRPCEFWDHVADSFFRKGEWKYWELGRRLKTPREVKHAAQRMAGKRIPDAWRIVNDELIVLWEVANHQRGKAAVDKWIDFAINLLDVSANYSLAVVLCDSLGNCTIPFWETWGQYEAPVAVTWKASEPCPINWEAAIQ